MPLDWEETGVKVSSRDFWDIATRRWGWTGILIEVIGKFVESFGHVVAAVIPVGSNILDESWPGSQR